MNFHRRYAVLMKLTVLESNLSKTLDFVENRRFSKKQGVSKMRHLETALYLAFSGVIGHNRSMRTEVCIAV